MIDVISYVGLSCLCAVGNFAQPLKRVCLFKWFRGCNYDMKMHNLQLKVRLGQRKGLGQGRGEPAEGQKEPQQQLSGGRRLRRLPQ